MALRRSQWGWSILAFLVAGGCSAVGEPEAPLHRNTDLGVSFHVPDFADPNAGKMRIDWGPTTTQPSSPPPVSGGTLLVTRDGRTAVAADPDRDAVYLVDLASMPPALRATVALQTGDEPGRVVEDGAGRVHVALRGGQALATLDLSAATVIARRPACAAPRGLAYEPATDRVHLACAGGELVSFPAAGGTAVRTLHLGRDLRDVVVDGTSLWVSRFRSASVIIVDAGGNVLGDTFMPPVFSSPLVRKNTHFEPAVAWRMMALPSGGAAMVHQRGLLDLVSVQPGGYGSPADPCGSIVHATVTLFHDGKPALSSPAIASLVLPVDVAVSPDGNKLAVVAAGNSRLPKAPQAMQFDASIFSPVAAGGPADAGAASSACLSPDLVPGFSAPGAQLTAVAYAPTGNLVLQAREPATLFVRQGGGFLVIPLSMRSRVDTGHDIFHGNAGAGLACASCHPEGGEDGRIWVFGGVGVRRTQSLRGGVLHRAPFHWSGDLPDLTHLMDAVFVGRMNAIALRPDQTQAFSTWLGAIPALAQSPPVDDAAVGRGQALFNDVNVGCTGCHTGVDFTNHARVDVGTHGAFKVPSLGGVAWRAPFLHDGCAATLKDRFGTCGGGDAHGHTSALSPSQIGDLVAYLETL